MRSTGRKLFDGIIRDYLVSEAEGESSDIGSLIDDIGLDIAGLNLDDSTNDEDDFYDVKNRCVAWFKAYKNWEEARDSPKPETNLSDGMSGETLGE